MEINTKASTFIATLFYFTLFGAISWVVEGFAGVLTALISIELGTIIGLLLSDK